MSSIREAYDRWSSTYDEQENRTRDLDESLLPRLAPPLSGRIVVEAGCGTGKNSRWLATQAACVVGLDFSTGMLRGAQRRLNTAPRVHLVQADIRECWPLATVSVDVVLFNLVLEHVPSLLPVMQEAARCLRRGGELFLSELHPQRLMEGSGAEIKIAGNEDGERVGSYFHDEPAYRAAVEASGLRVVRVGEWGASRGRPPRLLTLHAYK